MSRIWDDLLSPEEKEVIRCSGYGGRKTTGKSPALLVIDAQYNFFGARKPMSEQLDEYPTGIGVNAWLSVGRLVRVLTVARNAGIPVIFTRYVASMGDLSHENRMRRDHTKFAPGAPGSRIVEELQPLEGETVIDKTFASAFSALNSTTALLVIRLIRYS